VNTPAEAEAPPLSGDGSHTAPTRKSPLRWLRWFRPPRKLRLTREGKYFIGITFGVGFAAINTGNNLLYLLLGMLLSLIIVSGVLSELSLRELAVARRLPPRAQVGRPHLVEVEVFNHKARVPSYAIEIEDLREGQPADKRCFFLKISPRSAQVAAYRRTPARRGRDHHVGFRVATRFPFGLFEKSREIVATGELIIYPAVDAVRLPPDAAGAYQGGDGAPCRGGGDEVIGIRPMRDGDDARDIYWKKSTISDQMVLFERARELRRHVHFTLDTLYPGTEPSLPWLDRLEERIRDVASRGVANIRRGNSVVVRTTAGEVARAGPSTGADPLLRFLALLEPRALDSAPTRPPMRSAVQPTSADPPRERAV
jgi:uncharacterized protein (DUF58 family)